MRLFKNKKNNTADAAKGIIAENLTSFYNKLQSGWAGWMSQHTSTLSKRDWMLSLACFILLTGGYSTYLMVSGFTGTSAVISNNVSNIRKPAYTGQAEESQKTGAPLSDSEYARILRFRKYIDSLAADPSGKKVYDSIIQKRPGLMDSLNRVENYYQQFKNKRSWKTKK
ncbi:hypothetical protein FMM05_10335 [Flavobacterium zepuense]|uniref:Uncharacterized protein n=1 Tax=Flavobacterium zepuense TaxID=2593302 RepID=A0A552V189_9FLAO|nr:hypothetical protein [Flavobacterium zepuense]TRW24224.1 hypothetical protein FMM05_10335 [Flavobacterium zepuense]